MKLDFTHRLPLWLSAVLILLAGACSDDSADRRDSASDDKNVYACVLETPEFGWTFKASTARDFSLKNSPGNASFACTRLPFGYYRAVISTSNTSDGGHHFDNNWAAFTLAPDFKVVGYLTSTDYYFVTGRYDNVVLTPATPDFNQIPPYAGNAATRAGDSEDWYCNIASGILDIADATKKYSPIENVDWRGLLRRVASNDMKSWDSVPEEARFNLMNPDQDASWVELKIKKDLEYFTYTSTSFVMPKIESVETRNGKLRIHFLFEEKEPVSDNDFQKLRCGVLLYDHYDWTSQHRDFGYAKWLGPCEIDRGNDVIEYDIPVGIDFSSYVAVPFMINSDYIYTADPLVMDTDMMRLSGYEFYSTLLLDNSLTVSKIYDQPVQEQSSSGYSIRVTGHASCDSGNWAISFAWLPKDYKPGTPVDITEIPREQRHSLDWIQDVHEKDFDLRIPLETDIAAKMVDKDYTSFTASANLVIFITQEGDNPTTGDSVVCRWSYTQHPSVRFTRASLNGGDLSFSYDVKGSYWFDSVPRLDGKNYGYSLVWWTSSSYTTWLAQSYNDGSHSISSPYDMPLESWLLTKYPKTDNLPTRCYFRYCVDGKEFSSENSLKLSISYKPQYIFDELVNYIATITGISVAD